MAVRLIWLPEAIDDLDAITSYISIDSDRYARDFVARVVARAEGPVDLPLSGHLNPEAAREDVREISIYPYRLIYKVKQQEVAVLAVLHGGRLIDKIIGDRLS